MTLDDKTVEQLATHLEQAELNAQDVVKITDAQPDMDFEDAYAIQYAIRKAKMGRGQKFAGLKMGLTSRAKMTQMGVDTPIYGFLMDYMARGDGEEIRVDELIHPKIEPEIAFVTRTELKGPGCHIGDVLLATDFVLPAMEIIDSRYRDFKFDLKSVIADNTSSSRFVAGGTRGMRERLICAHSVSCWKKTARSSPPARGQRCWDIRPTAWQCSPTCWGRAAKPFRPARTS